MALQRKDTSCLYASITKDLFDNQFKQRKNVIQTNLYIHSLRYPGMLSYFERSFNHFGSIYIGTGQENKDLDFILNHY